MKSSDAIIFLSLLILPMLALGCGSRKGKSNDHFGTDVNWPTFNGPVDFFRSFGRAVNIMSFHKLDGKKVDTTWIGPAFRERLCLTVTINNHCVA